MSDPARHQRLRELFDAAVRLEGPDRLAFLDTECAGASDLRSEIDAILAGHDADPGFLERPALGPDWCLEGCPDTAGPAATAVPEQVGRYRIKSVLGSGAMGVVCLAEQDEPRRSVAVKLIAAGTITPSMLRRFRLEAQVLARLHHPNIAQVYEAGIAGAEHPVPFFAMEHVEGARSITDYAAAKQLTVRERVGLFAAVCDALHYAHVKGVIHRDLKPGNILVDSDGTPKVIDFGVARVTDADVTMATQTVAGQVVGTLRYMSPEQCAGAAEELDARSDIYALGVVLHELLTGESPYDLTSANSDFDIPRIVRENSPRPLGRFDRALRGDLETIVLACLEKEPARRYASAADVAAELRRFLEGRAIEARRDNVLYVAGKIVGRHRTAAIAASAALVLILAGLVTISVLYRTSQRRGAELLRRTYANGIALARSAWQNDAMQEMRLHLDHCPEPLRNWEWWHLDALTDDAVRVFGPAPPETPVRPAAYQFPSVASSPQMGIAAISDREGRVHVYDVASGAVRHRLFHDAFRFPFVRISRDGRRLVARTLRAGGTLRVWDLRDGRAVYERPMVVAEGGCDLDPSGPRVLFGEGYDVWVEALDGETAPRRFDAHREGVSTVRFAPDGSRFASGDAGGALRLWCPDLDEPVLETSIDGHVTAIRFAPGGRHVYVASRTGSINVVDVDSGLVQHGVARAISSVFDLALSADGRTLASMTNQVIELWDVEGWRPRAVLHVSSGPALGMAFIEQDELLLGGGVDGRLRLFDVRAPGAAVEIGRHDPDHADCAAASPDGRWGATFGFGRRDVVLWNLDDRRPAARWDTEHGHARLVATMDFGPRSERLLTSAFDETVRVWSVPTGAPILTIERAGATFFRACWSPDDPDAVWTASRDGPIELWSATTGARLDGFDPGQPTDLENAWASRRNRTFAVSPRGNVLATGGLDGSVLLWRRDGWTLAARFTSHDERVLDMAFSHDGRTLATAGFDGRVLLHDVSSGRLLRSLGGHGTSLVLNVTWLPDGRRLLTSAYEPAHRLWDPVTGELLLTLVGHESESSSVALTGDGRRFISGDNDGSIRLWAAPGYVSGR